MVHDTIHTRGSQGSTHNHKKDCKIRNEMVNRYDLLKDNTIFYFFSFQLSNCIYKENKTFHLLTCRETALPESFRSLSEAQNIFSDADTEPHKLGKYIYGYGLHSWEYRSVPNDSRLLGQLPNIPFI